MHPFAHAIRFGAPAVFAVIVTALAGTFLAHAAWVDGGSGLQTTTLGAKPVGLAIHSDRRLAVVVNEDGNSVSLVNADSGDVTATLNVAASPREVAVDDARSRAYVLHKHGSISVLDLAAATRIAEWAISANEATALAINADGSEIVIAAEEPHRVLRVATASGAVVQSLPLASEPNAMAYSTDGTKLFVATESAVRVFNTATWTQEPTIALSDIRALQHWPQADRLVAIDKRRLHVVDLATNAVDSLIAGSDLRQLAVDGARATAYASDKESNAIAKIDLTAKAYLGRYALTDEPTALALDRSQGRLLITLRKIDRLLRLDPATAALTPSVFLDDKLLDVGVDNGGDRAVVLTEKEKLFLINLVDKTNRAVVLPSKPIAVGIDESRAQALVGLHNGDLRFIDLANASLHTATISLGDRARDLAIDTQNALGVAVFNEENQVALIDLATRTLRKTLTVPGEFQAVAVQPSKQRAYLLSDAKDTGEIVVLDLTTEAVLHRIPVAKDANDLIVDDALDLAVVAVEEANKLQVVDLNTRAVVHTHTISKHPHTLALNADTHTVAIAAKDSDQIALLDLNTQTLSANFAKIDKPLRLDIGVRYNQALVIGAEQGEVVFIQLPNLKPVLTEIVPPDVTAPAAPVALLAVGQHFVDSSKIYLDGQPLTTRYKGPQHLEADVPPQALTTAGVYTVKIVTAAPGGGESAALNFTVLNPLPVLTAVAPSELLAGSAAQTITVTGQRFVHTAVVRFGPHDLATSFIDAQHLTAIAPAPLLAEPASVAITVFNPVPGGGASNPVALTIVPAGPKIASVTPSTGEPGTLIAIAGTGFDPLTTHNQVVFGGNVAATVQTATHTELRLTVPPGAITGPISLTTPKGTTQSGVFTVKLPEDFNLVASPGDLTLVQNSANSFAIQLTSLGTQPFTSVVRLTAAGLPPGVSAEFLPAAITANQVVTLKLSANTSALAETFTFQVIGKATLNGREHTRTATATVTLKAAGQTGIKGRFVDPDGRGIAGVYVRHETIETTSDAAGNFLLLGVPAGKITLRMDATPANPLYPIWPYQAEAQAGQVLVLNDWVINPPPTADKFKPLQQNAAHDQAIVDERYPGLKFTIPKGVSIVGWDGVPKDRIAVERIDVNKLPVPAPPVPIKESYQLYFGTPMGGIPSQPIPVTLPNVANLEPGEKSEVWYFDGSPMGGSGEWKLAGPGTISADGKTVTTDPGHGIPRFCGVCGLVSQSCPPPPNPPPPPPPPCPGDSACCGAGGGSGGGGGGPVTAGNPVDLFTGQELPRIPDITCGGLVPLGVGRAYNPVDSFNNKAGTTGSLGYGWTLNYDIALLPFQGPQKRLVTSGSIWTNFTDIGGGIYKNADDPNFDGALMIATNAAANEWEVRFKDGKVWRFKPFPGIPGVIRGGPPTFLTEIVDPQGNSLFVSRANNGHILLAGTQQRALKMSYGINNFISKIEDPIGRTIEFTYNANDRVETVKDVAGGITRYTYVGDNEFPESSVCPIPTTGERIKTIEYPGKRTITENHYGPGRRILRQTSSLGEYKFAYKLTGACVTNVSNPLTKCIGANCPDVDSWDNYQAGWRIYGGQIVATTVTDPKGQTRSHRFNPRGLVMEGEDGLGGKAVRKLDANNRVVQEMDVLGRTIRYFYDERGNKVREIGPENRVTDFEYDVKWNKMTQMSRYREDGAVVILLQNTYDPKTGSLASRSDANGNKTLYEYSTKGQLSSITDAKGKITKLVYNGAGDLTSVIDPLGNTIRFSRDSAGRAVQTTDALGHSTQFNLNARDQQTQVLNAEQRVTKFEYDIRGNLIRVTNPSNQVVQTITYDELDRPLTRIDGAGKSETYTYDLNGNVATHTDRKGQTTAYIYDENNRLLQISYADGNVERRVYDTVGRLVSLVDGYGVISYQYDDLNRPTQVTSNEGAIKYHYDILGRRERMETPQQIVTYNYDNQGNLAKISYGTEVVDLTYDENNRRTGLTYPNGIQASYNYDDVGRVTDIVYRKDSAVIESVSYGYDAGGNVIQRIRGAIGSKQESSKQATYDVKTDRLLTLNGATYDYDDNGNLIRRIDSCGTTDFRWDAKDQLVGMIGFRPDCSNVQATFAYDVLGRRTQKTINGNTTTYLYDGLNVIAEIGTTNALYLRSDNIDEAIARYTTQGDRYFLNDLLGSTLVLSDREANPKTVYSYSPFGETEAEGELSSNPVQYAGKENDGLGLYYYRARYFAPGAARFLSSDPIGIADSLNTYAYVDSNPIGFIDPEGLAKSKVRSQNRNCTLAERRACEAQCGSKGMRSCMVAQVFVPVRIVNKDGTVLTVYQWRDTNMSCDCNDPDEPFCKRNPGTCATAAILAIGACLVTPWPDDVLIPGIIGSGVLAY